MCKTSTEAFALPERCGKTTMKVDHSLQKTIACPHLYVSPKVLRFIHSQVLVCAM